MANKQERDTRHSLQEAGHMKTYGDKKEPQRVKYSFLKILTGSDLSRRRLPLMSVESANTGPVVWLTACIHGDEVTGIVTIQEVFKKIQRQHLLRGAVHAFPLMNPIGFETGSRNITLSREDLNRSFPGNKDDPWQKELPTRFSRPSEKRIQAWFWTFTMTG